MQLPYRRYTLQDLSHDPLFQDEVDAEIRSHMQYIVRMGNYGIHTGNKYAKGDAVLPLSILFDFVIIDEAHRSIYNKYTALFEYFDAYIVGLTATPKNMDADSTYSFFKCPPKLPTYAYKYEAARDVAHYLVPYFNIEASTQIMHDGVHYDDLSENE